jgi:hypothetical protein
MPEDTTETPTQPEPQQYPVTQYAIQPGGVNIQILFTPGYAHTIVIDEATMNAIAGKWLETRREIKAQMQEADRVIQHDTANTPVALASKRKAK